MIAGLDLLAIALGGSVLLITDMMFDGARVWIYTGAVVGGDRRAVVRAHARAGARAGSRRAPSP
jgi:hypothetical protein